MGDETNVLTAVDGQQLMMARQRTARRTTMIV